MAEAERPGVDPSEPLHPISLTPELAAFLQHQGPYACVTQATDRGTAYVIKAPASDIVSARGTVPIRVQHTLFDHQNAPVIQTVITIHDQPNQPMRLESFINVADESQRADFTALADQAELIMLFYDENLTHRLSKLVPTEVDDSLAIILSRADELRAGIPTWQYDFDRAKAAVMAGTSL